MEVTLPFTSCNTKESRPCKAPWQHSKANFVDWGWGRRVKDELAPRTQAWVIWIRPSSAICYFECGVEERYLPTLPLTVCNSWGSWLWSQKSDRALPVLHQLQHSGECPLQLTWATQQSLPWWSSCRTDNPKGLKAALSPGPRTDNVGELTFVLKIGKGCQTYQHCNYPELESGLWAGPPQCLSMYDLLEHVKGWVLQTLSCTQGNYRKSKGSPSEGPALIV